VSLLCNPRALRCLLMLSIAPLACNLPWAPSATAQLTVEFRLGVVAVDETDLTERERALLGCDPCVVLRATDGDFLGSPDPQLLLAPNEVEDAVVYVFTSPLPPLEQVYVLFLRVTPDAYLRFESFAAQNRGQFMIASIEDRVIGYTRAVSWLTVANHLACGSFETLADAAEAAEALGLSWSVQRMGEGV